MSSTEQVFGRAWQGAGSRRSAAAAEFLREFNAGLTHRQRLEQVRFIANLMDDRFVVPGTGLRFGLDSIVGLFPGFGDVITTAISLLIVHHAWQSGASKFTLARMLGNVGIDFVVGVVPVVRRPVRFRVQGEPQEHAPARGASQQARGQGHGRDPAAAEAPAAEIAAGAPIGSSSYF